MKVFTHLMLRGQVRSAVRFITDRVHGGGVLSLDASTGVPGHSVLDILREKHPEPGVTDESAFMSCDDLPPLLDLDITADYVERVAHQITVIFRALWIYCTTVARLPSPPWCIQCTSA